MSVFELPTVTLIPNGIHHPPIEDGRLLPNSVKKSRDRVIDSCYILYQYISFQNLIYIVYFNQYDSLKQVSLFVIKKS
uniref:hypothetical protein n=1 Tax=Enterococcus faecium TaxID=1352 RepID=UPI003100BB31